MTRRTTPSYLLAAMHGLIGIGAVAGGLMLMIDPSGKMLNIPASLLEKSPFTHFLIPGMILFLMLGVLPLLICLCSLTSLVYLVSSGEGVL